MNKCEKCGASTPFNYDNLEIESLHLGIRFLNANIWEFFMEPDFLYIMQREDGELEFLVFADTLAQRDKDISGLLKDTDELREALKTAREEITALKKEASK